MISIHGAKLCKMPAITEKTPIAQEDQMQHSSVTRRKIFDNIFSLLIYACTYVCKYTQKLHRNLSHLCKYQNTIK